jgi:hypothetical protein
MELILKFCALPILALIFVGCQNGHLSRSRAKSQVEALAKQNVSGDDLVVQVGLLSSKCLDLPSYDPIDTIDAMLADTGYITTRRVKQHLWDVELTPKGTKAVSREKYAHTQRHDCDYWQVTFPISRLDKIEVTGIVEDGKHANVEVSTIFVISPLGMDLRQQTSASSVLFDDLTNTMADQNSYATIQGTVPFEKYDDGWKISEAAKQAERAQQRHDTAAMSRLNQRMDIDNLASDVGRQEENTAQIRNAQSALRLAQN